MMKFFEVVLSVHALSLPLAWGFPVGEDVTPKLEAKTRMQKITSMYGFEGFVYALDVSVY